MSPWSPLLSLALGLGSPLPAPAVAGGVAAPDAWAAIAEDRLWVCWAGPGPCFEPVAFAGSTTDPDAFPAPGRSLQLAFADRSTLLVGTDGIPRWRVDRGTATAVPLAAASTWQGIVVRQPRRTGCGPRPVPAWNGRNWSFVQRSCHGSCIRRPPRLRLRRPLGIRLDLFVEFARGWAIAWRTGTRRETSLAVHAGVRLGFDPGARRRHTRQRTELLADLVPTRIELPSGDPDLVRTLCAASEAR